MQTQAKGLSFCLYLQIGDGLLSCGIIRNAGHIALRGEINVAVRPPVIEAVNAAAVMLEEVADDIAWIIV